MNKLKEKTGKYYTEIFWLLVHIGIGLVMLPIKFLSMLYATFILVAGIVYIFRTKNKNNEVLYVCAYLTGMDVFMHMTDGLVFSEQIKYAIILLLCYGMVLKHLSVNSLWYIVYVLLLVPGIFIAATNILDYDAEFRKMIAFNLSGPVCTGIVAIYCIDRKLTFDQLRKLLFCILLPIISMTVYITFFKVDIASSFVNTTSNFATSGGYGPNQVSVVLGLGMFVLLARFVFYSEYLYLKIIHIVLFGYLTYRGLITFSRGGVITGIAAMVPFLGLLFLYANARVKQKMYTTLGVLVVSLLIIWGYSNIISGGLLEKRYNNQDAIGREKEDQLGGREKLISYELQAFSENPVWGIGVGNNKFYREDESGLEAASHNEITRLMAEHGVFGIIAFGVLFLVPLYRFVFVHKNIYALSFFIFWFLTINHNATRIAFSSFLYGLTVIVLYNEKPTVHRQSAIGEG